MADSNGALPAIKGLKVSKCFCCLSYCLKEIKLKPYHEQDFMDHMNPLELVWHLTYVSCASESAFSNDDLAIKPRITLRPAYSPTKLKEKFYNTGIRPTMSYGAKCLQIRKQHMQVTLTYLDKA